MDQSKGKPVTTSVPLISIRFHANDEQLEELYASDEDHSTANDSISGSTGPSSTAGGVSEPESSPLKYLPRLVKRSTSIDITPNTTIDSSPPSDPWRFFSDIKGKITKSVEEKITEIKARNLEEGSPLKTQKVKDSKDNSSSVSDSEDLSESSISRTCGIFSTTEGAEMSSDDDTPSIENDSKSKTDQPPQKSTPPKIPSPNTSGLRQRFRLLKPKATVAKEGVITKSNLSKIYQINTDRIEQALPEDTEIESAVDALEDTNLQEIDNTLEILQSIQKDYDNIVVGVDGVVNVKEVNGKDVKPRLWDMRGPRTIYSPVGFVDLRLRAQPRPRSKFLPFVILFAFLGLYFLIHRYSSYLAGIIVGFTLTFTYNYITSFLDTPLYSNTPTKIESPKEIVEIQAVKEFQPLTKYEGWVNEFPDVYDPHTYHISQTQPVFLRLQGNLLRLSNTRTKVPKRALWNEAQIKPTFTHHRVYNLMGAQIKLLPEGLAKKRHWSKKYPICVTLKYETQLDFEVKEQTTPPKNGGDDDENETNSKDTEKKRKFGFRKKNYKVLAQRFSKLTEENEEFELDSDNSRASTPSPPSADDRDEHEKYIDDALKANLDEEDDPETTTEDWTSFTPDQSPTVTKLYLFGRTDREKEDWYRRLVTATHRGANITTKEALDAQVSISDILVDNAVTEADYIKYMLIFNKTNMPMKVEKSDSNEVVIREDYPCVELQWMNALLGRVLFDCLRDNQFVGRIKERIQRKLASIKLPYFIEGLRIDELSLGRTPPLIHRASRPQIDERGLWIDLDVTYEGLIVLILQTKLNLMKLKHPQQGNVTINVEHHKPKKKHHSHRPKPTKPVTEKKSLHRAPGDLHEEKLRHDKKSDDRPAMFNSDVDDSAESTSDEEMDSFESNTPQGPLDASGLPIAGLGGSSNTSKKFMKMVDRIAESKFFQAATEYRYIKKAMEGVSNTELRLRVEIKELMGTLVLNVPPPPSDRVWIGFRPTPDINLSAQPIVGERNITYLRITSWIERKLLQEFQKLLVIPNMEDITVPIMCPDLPH